MASVPKDDLPDNIVPKDDLPSLVPKPSVAEVRPSPEKEQISPTRIAGAGLTGGAVGALTPEIMTVLGFLPTPLSPFLLAGGQIARTARPALAFGGAVAGMGGSAATQAERRYGKPEETAFSVPGARVTREQAAGVAGEFIAPSAISAARLLARGTPIVSSAISALEKYSGIGGKQLFAEAAAKQLATLRGKEQATETSFYRDIFNTIQKADKATQADANQKIAQATTSADQVLANARIKAIQLVSTDKAAAEKVLEDGQIQALKVFDDAMNSVAQKLGILKKAKSAIEKAKSGAISSAEQIGNINKTNADTGTALREKIVSVQGDRITAREKQFKIDDDAVQAVVKQKESTKNFIENLPEYKTIVDRLDQRLLQGKIGREQVTAETTEQGILTQLKRVSDAIKPQIRQVGIDEQGNPVNKKFPVSFNAIDELRRKLGQAAFGKEAEGYEAIGADNARILYGQLSELQAGFSPGKKNLITNYEEASRTLDPFKTGAGKKATAVERFGDDIYKTDVSKLPNTYFTTRQSVKDLIELTGNDKVLVENSASDYVARELSGKKLDGVKKFVFDNKEWLSEFPALSSRVDGYIKSLSRSESVVPKTTELIKGLKTDINVLPIKAASEKQKVLSETKKAAETKLKQSRVAAKQIIKDAEKQAKEITGSVGKARELLGAGDPVQQIEKLILGGQTEKLADIAPYIKSSPELQRSFSKAIDITLSRASPKTITDDWERIIKPALENTGLIDAAKSKDLSKRIKTVQMTLEPGAVAETVRWILRTALAGEIGQITAPIGAIPIEYGIDKLKGK